MRPGQDDPLGTGPANVTRRRALRIAASVVGAATGPTLAACSWPSDADLPAPRRRPANADQPLLESSRADQQALLDLAEATVLAHPRWRSTLAPLATDLQTHVEVLGGATAPRSASTATPSAAASGASPTVPADARTALEAVVSAARTASAARVADTSRAVSGELARVLAAVAASDAQHSTVLATRLRGSHLWPAARRSHVVSGQTALDAVQAALAGEHAAVYGYGLIGGRLQAASSAQRRAAGSYRLHRARRDALVARVFAAGATPVQSEPGYALPVDVTDAASAARLARTMERRCAVLYAAVVAAADRRDRATFVDALLSCATQELTWGGAPHALPGVR